MLIAGLELKFKKNANGYYTNNQNDYVVWQEMNPKEHGVSLWTVSKNLHTVGEFSDSLNACKQYVRLKTQPLCHAQD